MKYSLATPGEQASRHIALERSRQNRIYIATRIYSRRSKKRHRRGRRQSNPSRSNPIIIINSPLEIEPLGDHRSPFVTTIDSSFPPRDARHEDRFEGIHGSRPHRTKDTTVPRPYTLTFAFAPSPARRRLAFVGLGPEPGAGAGADADAGLFPVERTDGVDLVLGAETVWGGLSFLGEATEEAEEAGGAGVDDPAEPLGGARSMAVRFIRGAWDGSDQTTHTRISHVVDSRCSARRDSSHPPHWLVGPASLPCPCPPRIPCPC